MSDDEANRRDRFGRFRTNHQKDPGNRLSEKMTEDQFKDYRHLTRKAGMSKGDALASIGLKHLDDPALPRLTEDGAYDQVDLKRYFAEASLAGLLPERISRELKVPLHRVIYMINRGKRMT